MSTMIPTPFSADQEEPQFMDHYSEVSNMGQRIVIVVVFLAVLALIVVLRDMLKTEEQTHEQMQEM